MSLHRDSPAIALVLAADVASDALGATANTLREFGLRAVQVSPDELLGLASAAAREDWCAVIVASADAALPAAAARTLPWLVVRVPMESASKNGLALLQTADGNLPSAGTDGVSFATVAIGQAGARNAALFVISVLSLTDARLLEALEAFRASQTEAVLQQPPPVLD